jgi:hypothetical protein
VKDLDRQVLALLTEELLALLADDNAGPMMWVNDVVANIKIVALKNFDLEIGVSRLFN